MYSLTVVDHVMIAHSFRGEEFGPAQRLHGATYIVDVEFRRKELSADGIVVDIGAASAALRAILATIEYRNLDDLPEFANVVTTTEHLARWLFLRMRAAVEGGKLGAGSVDSLRVVLHESHVAWAAYEAPLQGGRA